MKKFLNIVAFAFLILLIYSCSSEYKQFNDAKQANTIEAFTEFANNYPNGEYIDSVKEILDNMNWQIVLSKDSLKNYEIFMLEHPKSKFIDSAKVIVDKLMWKDAQKYNTIEDYETFIEDYPESKFIDSAKMMITKLKP